MKRRNSSSTGRKRVPGVSIMPLADVEKYAIFDALEQTRDDKLLAAQMLGIGKTTLYRKLNQYERQQKRGGKKHR